MGSDWHLKKKIMTKKGDTDSKGTRCLGSDELVYKKRLKQFVMKCIERCFKSIFITNGYRTLQGNVFL